MDHTEAMGRIALEFAFPAWAAERPSRDMIRENERVLAMLEDGSLGRRLPTEPVLTMYSGSKLEGLAMRKGYSGSDLDEMRVYGSSLRFVVTGGVQEAQEGDALVMRPEPQFPGFCRLEAVGSLEENVRRVAETRPWNESNDLGENRVRECFITDDDGRHWLLSDKIHRKLLPRMPENMIHGPAAGNDMREMSATFTGSAPLPSIQDFLDRPRQGDWPRPHTLLRINRLPALIVCKSHARNPLETFRWSWSHIEILLSFDMPLWAKQAYWAFKYCVKGPLDLIRLRQAAFENEDFVRAIRGVTPVNMSAYTQDIFKRYSDAVREANPGPAVHDVPGDMETRFSSFFLKTVLLLSLEDRTDVEEQGDAFVFFMSLTRRLREALEEGRLPHYFLFDLNLFANLHPGDRAVVQEAVAVILDDPIRAIVMALRHPEQLYRGGPAGDMLQTRLVDALQAFLVPPPVTEDTRDGLRQLLRQLDNDSMGQRDPSLESLMP